MKANIILIAMLLCISACKKDKISLAHLFWNTAPDLASIKQLDGVYEKDPLTNQDNYVFVNQDTVVRFYVANDKIVGAYTQFNAIISKETIIKHLVIKHKLSKIEDPNAIKIFHPNSELYADESSIFELTFSGTTLMIMRNYKIQVEDHSTKNDIAI